jgi:hypothetical protein
MRSVARQVSDHPELVRVFPRDGDPRWLVAEFTMPTGPQNQAVGRIDYYLRFELGDREDSTISFPLSDAQRARNKRKTERRRLRRRSRKDSA